MGNGGEKLKFVIFNYSLSSPVKMIYFSILSLLLTADTLLGKKELLEMEDGGNFVKKPRYYLICTEDNKGEHEDKCGTEVKADNVNKETVKRKKLSKVEVVQKEKSVAANTLLIPKVEQDDQPINVCIPKSLKNWKERKGIHETEDPVEKYCDTTVAEPSSNNFWDDLDQKLQNDELLSYFTKGKRPHDFSAIFESVKTKFAYKYLINDTID